MIHLPFYVVPLTHTDLEAARLCAKKLPPVAIPEVRLDLLPQGADAEKFIDSLKHHCIMSCRRVSEGGRWPDEDEAGRLELMKHGLKGRPRWVDLEWELGIPDWLNAELGHTRLLRSVHTRPGVFDIQTRLQNLPQGDAYKWVGHAGRLADNAAIKTALADAKNHRIVLSAFLQGTKGIVSRCMQGAWGGSFTYAAPDDATESSHGQIKLGTMMSWRCHKIHPGHGICGVIGSPVLQSAGPKYHNERFQKMFKDLIYLPLEADSPEEALEAMRLIPMLGASVTMPLKESLSALMGFNGPNNTIWHRADGDAWQVANTDAVALEHFLAELPKGPVLVLGSGGVAKTSVDVAAKMGHAAMHSRRTPLAVQDIAALAPVGAIQATSLGMGADAPLPFPDILEAALPTMRWAIDWVNREDTAFMAWAKGAGLKVVSGAELFEAQAAMQSRIFVGECGGGSGG